MSVINWGANSITVTVPSTASTGNVVVTVAGVASNGMNFTLTGAPSITTLNPSAAPVTALITITGSNFGNTQGTGTVKFNGVLATINSWNNTTIIAVVPGGATTGPVVVTTAGVDSTGVNFTVLPAPNITALVPNQGAHGATVIIEGANFGATQGTSTVTFQNAPPF